MFIVKDLQNQHVGPLNFSVQDNECVVISGASGSGKTLLLRALCDLDKHHGEMFLDEQEASQCVPGNWRRQVAMLPAESQWWAETVGEHYSEIDLDWLLQLGFDQQTLDWRVERLSSGEKQRLSLLRVLMNKPRVLLLDEPSANLDEENTTKIEQLIEHYRDNQQASVIWVSHDRRQIERVADRWFVIKHGQLIEQELQRDH